MSSIDETFTKSITQPLIVIATRAKFCSLKFIWISILFILTATAIYQISNLVNQLNANNKVSKIQIVTNPVKPFPTVTMCNLNPYKQSAIAEFPAIKLLFDAYEDMQLHFVENQRVTNLKYNITSTTANKRTTKNTSTRSLGTTNTKVTLNKATTLKGKLTATYQTLRTSESLISKKGTTMDKKITELWSTLLYQQTENVQKTTMSMVDPSVNVKKTTTLKNEQFSTKAGQQSVTKYFPCPNKHWYWDDVNNVCYFYNQSKSNFASAEKSCEQLQPGSTVAYFYAEKGFKGFLSFLNQSNLSCIGNIWLGLKAPTLNGPFCTIVGTQTKYGIANLSSSQYQCVVTNLCSQTYSTYNCNSESYFACQYRYNGASGDLCITAATTSIPKTNASLYLQTSLAYMNISVKDNSAVTSNELLEVQLGIQQLLPFYIAKLNEEQRSKLSYSLRDILFHCMFDKKICSVKDFYAWNDPVLGNCYSFNHAQGIYRVTQRAGVDYGLQLSLNASDLDYLQTTDSSGIKFILTAINDSIFFDTFSYTVPHGYTMDISLDYSQIKRLKVSYGDCVNEKSIDNYYFEGRYSPNGCWKTNYQKKVIETCKCGDPTYPLPNVIPQLVKFCDITQFSCIQTVYQQLADSVNDCKPSCTDNNYLTVSTSLKIRNSNKTQSQKDVAQVRIYHQKMLYIIYEERLVYTIGCFFTDMCNILGICLALAYHTLIELLFAIVLGTAWLLKHKILFT